MNDDYINMNVKIIVSDPWDFVTKNGSFFEGIITKFSARGKEDVAFFVKLKEHIISCKLAFKYALVISRYEEIGLSTINKLKSVPCNIILKRNEQNLWSSNKSSNSIFLIGSIIEI